MALAILEHVERYFLKQTLDSVLKYVHQFYESFDFMRLKSFVSLTLMVLE